MRLKDIEVGKKYQVKISERESASAWLAGSEVIATVTEVGIQRDVGVYMTYGGIKGTPRVHQRDRQADNVDGVRVEWETQGGYDRFDGRKTSDNAIREGTAVIAAKCVMEPADEINIGGEEKKKDAEVHLKREIEKGAKSAHLIKISGYWCVYVTKEDSEILFPKNEVEWD